MKNIFKITALITLFTFFGCKESTVEKVNVKEEVIVVKVAKVSTNNTTPFITSSGKVVAENSANISTRIMGYVKKVYVKTGSKVVKGQLLIEINNNDLQAKKLQAQANVYQSEAVFNNSQKDLKRFQQLFKENSASQKELDNIIAQFKVSKANLTAAKEMLNEVESQFNYFKITAPFDGVIVNKFIEEGNMANPGTILLSVENTNTVKIETMVSEKEITGIKKGAEVKVIISAINTQLKGKIAEISSSSINTGGQFLVTILLDKTNVKVLSGMYATVQFSSEIKTTESAVLIPEKAIIKRGQLQGIYTISTSGTAILRWLRLGKKQGENVEVISGLTNGETYIVSSTSKLFNGAKVSAQ